MAETLAKLKEILEPYRGERLVVAVSGGVDSVALLDLLDRLKDELQLTLFVAHADHGLRADSASDEQFVRKLVVGYKLPYRHARLKLPKAGNTEAAAREARYAWLEKIRQQTKAAFVVTAHHANDQVETLFLHLARGSGLTGLVGMPEVQGHVLRPLLHIPRREIEAYAKQRNLTYRTDPTNQDLSLARNRIRRQVVPSLEKINPRLVETVSQSMGVLGIEHEALRELAETELANATTDHGKDWVELDVSYLDEASTAIRYLIWRAASRQLFGHLQGWRLVNVADLENLLNLQAGRSLHLPRGLRAYRRAGSIMLKKGGPPTEPGQTTLPLPGVAVFGHQTVTATQRKADAASAGVFTVDRSKMEGELVVRSPRRGDRFQPVGMAGSKLVSDMLAEAKVPREERPFVPVVTTSKQEVVWVAGYRGDRRFTAAPGRDGWALQLTT